MRVFLLGGTALLDAARIAIQCVDPWASEAYCSMEDYVREKHHADRLVFIAPFKSPAISDEIDPAEHFYRRCLLIPEYSVPRGEIHVPIPTPATERY